VNALLSLSSWLWLLLIIGLVAVVLFYLWWTRVHPEVPRLDREWEADQARTPRVRIEDGAAHFTDLRDFVWRTTRDRDEIWIDKTVRLDNLVHVWYIVVHFPKVSSLAHTMLSFEFKDGAILTASFEARREKGERYNPWSGLWRTYELYLAWGTENDLLGVRTQARTDRVHIYRVVATPEKERAIFIDLCNRAEQLAGQAEWYNSVRNTCLTSLVNAVNLVTPGRVPFTWRMILPGHSAKAALKFGLIEDWGGAQETLKIGRIDQETAAQSDRSELSQAVRAHLPKANPEK